MSDQGPASDADLVQGLLNGVDSAGTGLFEKYSGRVYYLALRELRSHADAQDVRSETFLRVFRAIQNQQLRAPDALASFILGIARNVIMETFRSPHRAPHESEMPDLPAPIEDPMLDEEARQAIAATLRRLKPREREFLRLHYYEDLPKEEIARRIGIAEDRVRLIKHRSLKSFREMYERLKKIADTKRGAPSLQV
ncbi:putative RNA polymerase, sigma-24 subunit, ECF subfamily [Candidatus Sulfopaludibacter sp. SbA4]|nr:putative RNA polymerase, sigma-24 subunit, ECF subfamily [Candidatus Sulfopaludibacter sp. SbA4]